MKWIDDAVDCHHCTPEFAGEVRELLAECERVLAFYVKHSPYEQRYFAECTLAKLRSQETD